MNAQNLESMKAKIEALLRKAEGTTNEHERDIFMSKAHELMEKHQIDATQFGGIKDDVIISSAAYQQVGNGGAYKKNLFIAVSQYYGCNLVQGRKSGSGKCDITYLDCIGRESAVVTVEMMFPYLMNSVRQAAKELSRINGDSPIVSERAVANALIFRLAKLTRDNREQTDVASPRGRNELMTINEIDAKMAEEYGKLNEGRKSSLTTSQAAKNAADKISLNTQVSSSSVAGLLS